MKPLRIGTRGSELAMWQANFVRQALHVAHVGLRVEMEVIATRGDKVQDRSLSSLGGKGLFTKEIEDSLLAGRVDLAVHSLKDLPAELPPGLALAAILRREDPAEALLSRDGLPLEQLPPGAQVMTGSLRRQAQLRHRRWDLTILPVRGNVPTRVRKFRQARADGIVLACAGLIRLGLDGQITQRLDPAEFLPACGQGAMAIEIRSGDKALEDLCRPLEHLPTRLCVTAERAFLAALGGGCQAPIGAYGRFPDGRDRPTLTGMLAAVDGSRLVRKTAAASAATVPSAAQLGRQLARAVLAEGVADLLQQVQHLPKPSSENA